MKKLLFIMAAVACLLSCRSVKSEGFVDTHYHSNASDSLVVFSFSGKSDSTKYYHGVIDSLSRELNSVRQMYRSLYVRDSINENRYQGDSVHVTDSAWMQINDDGSITYYKYREKNSYSFQQLERYKQQVVKESQATIDSLSERCAHLQACYDSISHYRTLEDSVSMYRSKFDSISHIVQEKEKTTIKKNSLWDSIKLVAGTVVACVIIFVIVMVYRRFFCR